MKINIANLQEDETISLEHEYNATAENIDFYDQHYCKSIMLLGTAHKEAHCLFIEGVVRSAVEMTCSRCLCVTSEDFQRDVKLSICFQGEEEIDITDDIRELLIFEHPVKFLCNENCKGLCPTCGKDNNIEECECEHIDEGGTFSQLKELL
ncbi:DUF177 domain-containing protein [Candidatus Omnitrophota bacterium]